MWSRGQVKKCVCALRHCQLVMQKKDMFPATGEIKALRTYSMEQRPSWEANRSSANQENSPHFIKPEGSLPHSQQPATCPYPAPDRYSPRPAPHFSKINFNITLTSRPGSSKWSASLKFPNQNPVHISPPPHTCYTTCPSQSSWFRYPSIWWAIRA